MAFTWALGAADKCTRRRAHIEEQPWVFLKALVFGLLFQLEWLQYMRGTGQKSYLRYHLLCIIPYTPFVALENTARKDRCYKSFVEFLVRYIWPQEIKVVLQGILTEYQIIFKMSVYSKLIDMGIKIPSTYEPILVKDTQLSVVSWRRRNILKKYVDYVGVRMVLESNIVL